MALKTEHGDFLIKHENMLKYACLEIGSAPSFKI